MLYETWEKWRCEVRSHPFSNCCIINNKISEVEVGVCGWLVNVIFCVQGSILMYFILIEGCGRWIWILCKTSIGNSLLGSQLLWRVWQCGWYDVCGWNFDVLLPGIIEQKPFIVLYIKTQSIDSWQSITFSLKVFVQSTYSYPYT